MYLNLLLRFPDLQHWRHIEDKAKIVAAVWGTEFVQFLAPLAILYQDDLKIRMNSSFSSYNPGAINPFLYIIPM